MSSVFGLYMEETQLRGKNLPYIYTCFPIQINHWMRVKTSYSYNSDKKKLQHKRNNEQPYKWD